MKRKKQLILRRRAQEVITMPKDIRYREFNALKIWHHAARLQALAEGCDVAPVTVEVDPVNYCNHHCFWCVDPTHIRKTMPRKFALQLLDELQNFQVNGFRVLGIVYKGGGEPTLHPNFAELVAATRERGFEVGVVTNGSRLTQAGIAEALAEWASYVRISIDGPTPETHHRIHKSRDFDQIVVGVESLVQNRKSRHPIIGLSFAMDYVMVPVIPESIALGERLGVDYVLIRPPFFEEVCRASTMTAAEAAILRSELQKAGRAYHGAMEVFVGNWVGDAEMFAGTPAELSPSGRRDNQLQKDPPIEHRLRQCWASPLLTVITADGTVYGCCNLRLLENWALGRVDYATGVTFAQIWYRGQRKQVLARMHDTHCIQHCTHPLARYNEIIEVLRDREKPHCSFV
jgi:MoaA/NifB/PqqE/SkfB family radical SAM enzyme